MATVKGREELTSELNEDDDGEMRGHHCDLAFMYAIISSLRADPMLCACDNVQISYGRPASNVDGTRTGTS